MHNVLFWILGGFAALGALDRILGNPWGLGREFENGLQAMGSLMLAMAGIVTLSPILAAGLKPMIVPVFQLLGADPAMFAGSILACDMGGGALARELTNDPLWAVSLPALCWVQRWCLPFLWPWASSGRRTARPWQKAFSVVW